MGLPVLYMKIDVLLHILSTRKRGREDGIYNCFEILECDYRTNDDGDIASGKIFTAGAYL